jgi:hypothetical protein
MVKKFAKGFSFLIKLKKNKYNNSKNYLCVYVFLSPIPRFLHFEKSMFFTIAVDRI